MLLTVLVSIVVVAYIVEALLDHLNEGTARRPLDKKIAHLYDEKEREKSIAYSSEKTRFGFISATFSTVIMVFALAYGWFAKLDDFVREQVNFTSLYCHARRYLLAFEFAFCTLRNLPN
ncbi:MAG: hypothetical protein RL257_693 [Actinomycetota bacterium]